MPIKPELLSRLNIRLLYQSIKHFTRTHRLKRKNDCADRALPHMIDTGFRSAGDITSYNKDKNKVTVAAQNCSLQISFLEKNLLTINIQRNGNITENYSYALDDNRPEWTNPEPEIRESEEHIQILCGNMRITVRKDNCLITITDTLNNPILEEADPIKFNNKGAVSWALKHHPGTRYHGLGERASGFDLTDGKYTLWNTDPSLYNRGDDPLYLNVPFLFMMRGSKATGLFIDNSFRSSFDITLSGPHTVEYRSAGDGLCAYIMSGTPPEVMQHYTALTGRMNMPPLWALGYHQSRWSYYPQSKVLEIANEFRQRKLPCDVIHIDIDYMDGYRCFTWDTKRFPDPKKMINTLHGQGFKVLSMIDPGIKVDPEYHVYRDGMEKDVFIKYPDGTPFTGPVWPGNCHFPDFTDPEVREWWGELYEPLLDDGIDAFWNDMNEIALITFLTGTTVPDCIRHSFEKNGADHAGIHNYYGMLMAQATAGGIQKLRPGKRPFVLSRAGWAGLQRYAVNWTGDNRSTWDHLRLTVSMLLNLGLSGIPFTGPDIGGFAGKPSPELFARWMQLGAFIPFFRNHTMKGSPDQEPWSFGREIESICRKYLELRYRLLPYLYTAVWQAHEKGIPIARPLWFVYPDDDQTYTIDDQYLFGDSFLIAPVLHKGQGSRTVYLPDGNDWYDYRSNKKYTGGSTISVDAPVDTLPLFVRAGSIIPVWPSQLYVREKSIEELELLVYWSEQKCTSMLYEDDSDSTDYKNRNKYRLTEMILNDTSRGSLQFKTVHNGYESRYRKFKITSTGCPEDVDMINLHVSD